jgi:photosystem II stability/assembly factor-like uncharacterized protein
MPLTPRRTVYSTVVALAAAGLAAGCATTSSSSSASSPSSPSSPSSLSSCAGGAASAPTSASASAGSASAGSASADAPALDAVQFTDPTHGWVAGAGAILATTDGGRAWTRQYSGAAALDQVDFIDAEHGWAAGGDTLLRTTNGGATWTALAEPCQGELNSIHFVSPTLGYAVAAAPGDTAGEPAGDSANDTAGGGAFTQAVGGSLLRTSNGGQTWTALAGAPANAQSECFANAADGYLGTLGHIWRSTDGGQRWTLALTEPAPSVSPKTGDTPEIECAGTSGLWVLFLGQGAALSHAPYLAYASQDGQQWHGLFEEHYIEFAVRPSLKLPDGPGSYPGPFSAIDSGLAAFVGYTPPLGYGAAPVMLASADGRSLTREGNVTAINEPFGASFLSPSQGWVVGENLQTDAFEIEATANAGRTWTTEYTTR